MHVARNQYDPNSLSDNYVTDLNIDQEGGIWISCRYEGINYFDKDNNVFTHHFPAADTQTRQVIVQVVPDADGNLWVATENSGLFFLDHTRQTMERRHPHYQSVASVMVRGNELWIGKGVEGLDIVDIETGRQLPQYADVTGNAHIKGSTRFTSLHKTSKALIAGTTEGLFAYDEDTGHLRMVEGLPV